MEAFRRFFDTVLEDLGQVFLRIFRIFFGRIFFGRICFDIIFPYNIVDISTASQNILDLLISGQL